MSKLIVGLGNPGKRYAKTPHNAGFMAIDVMAQDRGETFRAHKKSESEIAKFDEIILAKPTTFMNNSGRAVAKLMNYFNVALGDVLVVYDDVDLPIGAVRFRAKGGSAGHNGVKSIIDALGTEEFKRVRIGIGTNNGDTSDYVMGSMPTQIAKKIKEATKDAARLALDNI